MLGRTAALSWAVELGRAAERKTLASPTGLSRPLTAQSPWGWERFVGPQVGAAAAVSGVTALSAWKAPWKALSPWSLSPWSLCVEGSLPLEALAWKALSLLSLSLWSLWSLAWKALSLWSLWKALSLWSLSLWSL